MNHSTCWNFVDILCRKAYHTENICAKDLLLQLLQFTCVFSSILCVCVTIACIREIMAENCFDCPDLVCKAVTVYSDRAEVKRLVSTTVKVRTLRAQRA